MVVVAVAGGGGVHSLGVSRGGRRRTLNEEFSLPAAARVNPALRMPPHAHHTEIAWLSTHTQSWCNFDS